MHKKDFSKKELKLLGYIAIGRTDKEISYITDIPIRTINYHVLNLRKKLKIHKDVGNPRVKLIREAIWHELIVQIPVKARSK